MNKLLRYLVGFTLIIFVILYGALLSVKAIGTDVETTSEEQMFYDCVDEQIVSGLLFVQGVYYTISIDQNGIDYLFSLEYKNEPATPPTSTMQLQGVLVLVTENYNFLHSYVLYDEGEYILVTWSEFLQSNLPPNCLNTIIEENDFLGWITFLSEYGQQLNDNNESTN